MANKRERSINFTTSEIRILTDLVKKYQYTIENKKTDACTWKDKEAAWNALTAEFNACSESGHHRSMKTLKLKYEGIKKSAKKKVASHTQSLYRTGGGSISPVTFTDYETKVLEITSNIGGLEARNDSDAIALLPSQHSTTIVNEPFIAQNELKTESTTGIQMVPQESPIIIVEDVLMENDTVLTEQTINNENYSLSKGINEGNSNNTASQQTWKKWDPKLLSTKKRDSLKCKAEVNKKYDLISQTRVELVETQLQAAKLELELKMGALDEQEREKAFLKTERELKLQILQCELKIMQKKLGE